ncbi:MAG: response regulator [Phocaeicola sp.]|uniref:hybrid sensor histidine kinase/response regulator transcription factor n=1 Tax=Phocaeicola sp. TaxID=2773926 RepID=UPI0023CD881F|nr:hybrid sensor histidine kinase/response regulator transcription factor [Phocaeicola sp.]MDE5678670.1 response regulator [Phocaeicola sp.]MDE6180172.1 response regulator [Phocaeicola sp.]
MNYRYVLLICAWLLSCMSVSAEYFRQIGLAEGLTQPSVMAIYQDQLGRMWFGTREGINMYDGKQVTSFKGWVSGIAPDTSVWLGNEVSAIVGDSLGNIFFLVDDDLIEYDIRAEKFIRLSYHNQIPVLAASGGDIWYMRNDSIFCHRTTDGQNTLVAKTHIKASVSCMTILPDKIIIGTLDGAYFIDRVSLQQTHVLEGTDVYQVFESSDKEIWLGTRMHGLYRMKEGEEVRSVPFTPGSPEGVSSWQIRAFVEDNERNVWFGTFDGLQKYNTRTQEYSLIRIPQYASGLTHPSIFSLYKDRQGTIWVGSYFGGVNYFIPRSESFMRYDYDKSATRKLYYSYIGDILTDRDGHLWLSTDGGGITCTDKEWNIVCQLTAEGANSLPHNNIKSIAYDEKNHCLYIGTYLGGLSRYDIRTGHFHNYLDMQNGEEAPNEIVYHVKMWNDQLYLSARNGVFRLDVRTQRFHKLDVPSSYCEYFDIDPDGNMYLARKTSFLLVNLDRLDDVQTVSLPLKNNRAQITHIWATTSGAYASTLGGGVFFYERIAEKLHRYTAGDQQLPSDFCYNVCTSRDGRVLITSDQGVTCFQPYENRFTTLNLRDDFSSSYIINGCGMFVSDEGRIFIGDTQGVTVLSEKDFDKAGVFRHTPDLYFSQLWVNNQLVVPQDETGILNISFPYTDRLTLNHRQNNLVIGFALPDYEQLLSKKQYRYKLEGFDQKWIRTRQPEAHYTNLAPGTYIFKAAMADDGQNTTGSEISLKLVITSPWYDTWWAWIFYAILSGSCLYYFITSRIAKRTLALSLEKERFEKQQIEKLNHEKLVFFTNVSHEFRTPLTLIISHIDILLQKYSLTPSIYNQILKIRKNAGKMNNLISELLEFRKLEQNYEILQLSQQDIVAFLKEIYLSFADYAHQRGISYDFRLLDAPVGCWFDAQLMEKVFFNLLSNAFKYTSDGGSIFLSGEIISDRIVLRITDTGIGISAQETSKIFTRFYQSEDPAKKNSFFSGTGIGLALTKTIVEKHHGTIRVESVVGEGTTFIVELPRLKEEFADDQNVRLTTRQLEEAIVQGSFPEPYEDKLSSEETEPVADKSRTLLLVEDNEELLQVLVELFTPFYQIICAHNGKEGLKQVYQCKPDLIVSDVMMPEMTGTEMCLQIKNNLDLCHIPVILLTALNSPEQNIEGFNRGADDYITKPFHARLLLTRVNNLIRSRLLIQHQFDKQPISEIDLTSINPLDKDLLKRVSQVIEQHISDLEFDIPLLCREVGVGRSLLYMKFKALTGMTPNNYILNYRLKYAATLLRQYADLPIAEVSDRCGFNSPMYFSRCFKNQYGCSPQNYKKEKKSEERTEKNGGE